MGRFGLKSLHSAATLVVGILLANHPSMTYAFATLPHFKECTTQVSPGASLTTTVDFKDHWYKFSFDLNFRAPTNADVNKLAEVLDIQDKHGQKPQPGDNMANMRTGFYFPVDLKIERLNSGGKEIVYQKQWDSLMYLGFGDYTYFMVVENDFRLEPDKYVATLKFLDGARLPDSASQLCFEVELPGKH